MIKKVYGVSLDELGISLINIRSTGFENVAQLFHDLRIRRKCSILTDLDDAICNTTILEGDSDRIKNYKTNVENSKKSGLTRKAKLDTFESGNDWVKTFYAKYTFEVDFIKAGNAWEAVQTIDKVYVDDATKQTSKTNLNSKDVSLYGKRILKMAKQEGKGWFAIMLGEHITYQTIIPEYIVSAVIFAKEVYSENLIADIVEYRLNKNIEYVDKLNLRKCFEVLGNYRIQKSTIYDLYAELNKVIGDDQIITFLNYFL